MGVVMSLLKLFSSTMLALRELEAGDLLGTAGSRTWQRMKSPQEPPFIRMSKDTIQNILVYIPLLVQIVLGEICTSPVLLGHQVVTSVGCSLSFIRGSDWHVLARGI